MACGGKIEQAKIPDLPPWISCYTDKCCYNIHQDRTLQICGGGSFDDVMIYGKVKN